MRISITQMYLEPDAQLPLSHHFQNYIADVIAESIKLSSFFTRKYGKDRGLAFVIGAKHNIATNEIIGPATFKNDNSVYYSIFLPFDFIQKCSSIEKGVDMILDGVEAVLSLLEIDCDILRSRRSEVISHVMTNENMIDSDW
jgi:hypothetical protein